MTTTQQSTVTNGYSAIRSRPIRHDGTDQVTSRARYGADLSLPGERPSNVTWNITPLAEQVG